VATSWESRNDDGLARESSPLADGVRVAPNGGITADIQIVAANGDSVVEGSVADEGGPLRYSGRILPKDCCSLATLHNDSITIAHNPNATRRLKTRSPHGRAEPRVGCSG